MAYLLLSLFILILDQGTKLVVTRTIEPFESITILPFFQLVYVENLGAAFGLFKSFGSLFFVAAAVIAIVLVSVWIIRAKEERFALSLILGGAAGNLTDRLLYGYVIDFIDLHLGRLHWPAFNVADMALTIGISLLFIRIITRR